MQWLKSFTLQLNSFFYYDKNKLTETISQLINFDKKK